ncbi:MAG: M23 family metallopeptidase [Gemmatimonadota bacterium]
MPDRAAAGIVRGVKHATRLPFRLVALALVGAASACAPAGAAGPAPSAGPALPAPIADAPVPAAAVDSAERAAAAADAEDLRARAAAARAAIATRGPSILPFGVVWRPAAQEGSAFGIRLLERPSGRKPVRVSGEFADVPVRFGRLNGAWYGLAAAPIGSSGNQELRLRFGFEDGSETEQRVPIRVEARTFDSSRLRVAPRYSSPPPEALDRIARERELVRSALDAATGEWLIDEPFRAPRPMTVTAPYGQERVFNGELQSRHTGLDLKGAPGEPVRAAARGRVVIARDLYFSGNGVYLDHGLGVYTGYFHLSRIRVEEGEMVEAGQRIGDVGATGRVTGPHLHWSLWVAGRSLDASSLLEAEIPLAPGAGSSD